MSHEWMIYFVIGLGIFCVIAFFWWAFLTWKADNRTGDRIERVIKNRKLLDEVGQPYEGIQSVEDTTRSLYFEVAGAGKFEISKGCRNQTGYSHGFHIGVSWGRYGYIGGVMDREVAKELAEHILTEYEKITPEMKAEEQRRLMERDERLKKAGFIS